MKKPPKKIKILHLVYRIRIASRRECDAQNDLGWVDRMRQLIYLNPDVKRDRMREVLFHEIQHVLNELVELERAGDESIATRAAVAWMTVFKDNPKLVKWFFGK